MGHPGTGLASRIGLKSIVTLSTVLLLVCGGPAAAESGDDAGSTVRHQVASEVAEAPRGEEVQSIEVRRVKPAKEKKPSLRFLKENIAFLRGRIDGLEASARNRDGDSRGIDPRWLAYLEMTQEIETAEERLRSQTDALEVGRLLDDITELARIEARLQELENLLASESERLDQIQEDFVGRQRTTLVVLLQGQTTTKIPRGMTLVREDGTEVRVTVGTALLEALGRGATAQADHDFVEPREQWMALSLPGQAGEPGATGYIEFSPVRDQVNFIELDLDSMVSTAVDAWQARFWSRPYGEAEGGISATW